MNHQSGPAYETKYNPESTESTETPAKVKRVKMVLSNDFHGTEMVVHALPGDGPGTYFACASPRQQRRIWAALCGSEDCACGVIRMHE